MGHLHGILAVARENEDLEDPVAFLKLHSVVALSHCSAPKSGSSACSGSPIFFIFPFSHGNTVNPLAVW